MKAIILIAGSVGLLTAPAVAGNAKKLVTPTKVASVEKAKVAAPEVAAAAIAPELAAPVLSPEMIALPDLPVDKSSMLVPFPELESGRAVVTKPAKATKQKPVQMNMGNGYVLGKRQSAKPSEEVVQIVPKSLSQAQVATVIQSNMGDIQECWNALPKSHRADACTADLRLSISDAGSVTDIEIGGNVPASAHKCISTKVSRWAFPVAETKSEIEYGISLRTL